MAGARKKIRTFIIRAETRMPGIYPRVANFAERGVGGEVARIRGELGRDFATAKTRLANGVRINFNKVRKLLISRRSGGRAATRRCVPGYIFNWEIRDCGKTAIVSAHRSPLARIDGGGIRASR